MILDFKTYVSRSHICYMRYRYCCATFSFIFLHWQKCPLCFMYYPVFSSFCHEKQREDLFWPPTVIFGFSRSEMMNLTTSTVISPWPRAAVRTTELLALMTPGISALPLGHCTHSWSLTSGALWTSIAAKDLSCFLISLFFHKSQDWQPQAAASVNAQPESTSCNSREEGEMSTVYGFFSCITL